VPPATVGAAYSQTFTQTGGVGTTTFSKSGTMPPGLNFNAASATLSGTPTQAGSFSFTVTATDSLNGSGSQNYTLVVNAAPTGGGGGGSSGGGGSTATGPQIPSSAVTPNQIFVAEVYVALLNRTVDAASLTAFSVFLDFGLISREELVNAILHSGEYLTLQVNNLYRKDLHRDADAGALALDVAFLEQGGSLQQLEMVIILSPEFQAQHH
jgi:hypothetical protein